MRQFRDICEQAARAGGQVLVEMRGNFTTREKAPADLVTEADVASQAAIKELVLNAYPEHNFVGEEDESAQVVSDSEFTWIVDPLDGTTNYVHGLENYSVSVALQRDSEVIAGCVFDPINNKCFSATLGDGALCNGQALQVSSVTTVGQALIAASLPARVEHDSAEVKRFLAVLYQCQAIRRLGSAALNLCYTAAGNLDAYWATSVKKWDVAAGLLILQEAGGCATDLEGQAIDLESPKFIVSSSDLLQRELIDILRLS